MVDPKLWGPGTWQLLHYIAQAYAKDPSPEERRAALEFFSALVHLLPCTSCRKHYVATLLEMDQEGNPLSRAVENSDHLREWVVGLHNKVNGRLHHPQLEMHVALRLYHTEDGNGKCLCQTEEESSEPPPPPKTMLAMSSNGPKSAIMVIAIGVLLLLILGAAWVWRDVLSLYHDVVHGRPSPHLAR